MWLKWCRTGVDEDNIEIFLVNVKAIFADCRAPGCHAIRAWPGGYTRLHKKIPFRESIGLPYKLRWADQIFCEYAERRLGFSGG